MWLWIYLPLTFVIYLLLYISGIKAVAVSKTTKGKKLIKSYTVKCAARKQAHLKLTLLLTSLQGVKKCKFTLCVYMHCLTCNTQGLLLTNIIANLANSLLQKIIMQQWANNNICEDDSRSGWIGFFSIRYCCQHGSNIRIVQIPKLFWFVVSTNILRTIWIIFIS